MMSRPAANIRMRNAVALLAVAAFLLPATGCGAPGRPVRTETEIVQLAADDAANMQREFGEAIGA